MNLLPEKFTLILALLEDLLHLAATDFNFNKGCCTSCKRLKKLLWWNRFANLDYFCSFCAISTECIGGSITLAGHKIQSRFSGLKVIAAPSVFLMSSVEVFWADTHKRTYDKCSFLLRHSQSGLPLVRLGKGPDALIYICIWWCGFSPSEIVCGSRCIVSFEMTRMAHERATENSWKSWRRRNFFCLCPMTNTVYEGNKADAIFLFFNQSATIDILKVRSGPES